MSEPNTKKQKLTPYKNILVDNAGNPVSFHILGYFTKSDRSQLINMILEMGGKIVPDLPSLVDGVLFLTGDYKSIDEDTLKQLGDVPIYRDSFIYQCFVHKTSLPIDTFRIDKNVDLAQDLINRALQESVDHVTSASTAAAAAVVVATNGLSSKPDARTSKIQFTPEEDRFILDFVRRNPKRRNTHQLYTELAQHMKNHTNHSIRHRFRRNLSAQLDWVYDIDPLTNQPRKDENGNYIKIQDLPQGIRGHYSAQDDYNLCLSVQRFIESVDETTGQEFFKPLKGVFDDLESRFPHHTKTSWRDRFRKFASKYGVRQYIAYYEKTVELNGVPNPMTNFTSKASIEKFRERRGTSRNSGLPGPVGVEAVSSLDQISPLVTSNSNSAAAAAAAAAVAASASASSAPNTSTTNFFEQENIAQVLSAHNNEQSIAEVIESAQNVNTHESEPIADHVRKNLTDDELLDKMDDILSSRSLGGLDDLIKILYTELGFAHRYTEFLFTSCSGDVIFFRPLVEHFLLTGEWELENTRGIWTGRQDEMLRASNLDDLHKLIDLHGKERVETRRKAIKGE
ncbi:hypothetical protein LJB42_000496 [Komagataella kurtzmanii]|nr:hypothetical protein LJB42_000496 [Komagataella kurtzmanii]